MEVAAFSVNYSSTCAGIFFSPFRDNVIVGVNCEQALENQRKAVGGGFFERQNLYVIVIEPEVASMTFKMGLTEVIV